LARHEGNPDLVLECSWRLADWYTDRDNIAQTIESLPPISTPRRRIFEALLQLIKSSIPNGGQEAAARDNFVKICTNGIELALRKWFSLPDRVGPAHIPVLHTFQQFVELQESGQVFQILANTTAANYETRMVDVKSVLMAWRERLPNEWDDINIWSDLVAWRQHIFQAINRTLLPLLPSQSQQTQSGQGSQANSGTLAYRGYHETAWTVNRFAHVARKHHLMDVCISALNKIYTLPNIEIQEAFLKLREQAKSHYYTPGGGELTQGLEVINNTNLVYFNTNQKAEFFCLKGMFLSKLGIRDEASAVFNQAVTLDMHFAKGWAEWGEFHDKLFKENPSDLALATNAASCYLQAAGLFKNQKARKLLIRILWLLSFDDGNGTVAKAFDAYKGDLPIWYWLTFIPQLLLSLSHREAKIARIILLKAARTYPQASSFPLALT
jgi:transformation/transcription domain-associated protein